MKKGMGPGPIPFFMMPCRLLPVFLLASLMGHVGHDLSAEGESSKSQVEKG